MGAASLAVALIGQALAQAPGLVTKHVVKRADRLHALTIPPWTSLAIPGETRA